MDVQLHFLCALLWFLKRVYFRPLMSLRVYSNRFLILRNHTGIVILREFHSWWILFALDQMQLDAYCTVVWRQYEASFKLQPVIPIFERNKMTECPRKPRQPTSIKITWHIQTFFHAVGTQSLVFSFRLCASSRFPSQLTVNSIRRTLFFESDHATMSGRFSVWIIWTRNCSDVLGSTEAFQLLAQFSSFILDFFISSQGIHLPCETELWVLWLLQIAGLLAYIVLLTTLWPPPTPCYVAMCTSEAIVDMQMVHGARYPDHIYTKSTDPNRYIPIILGWSHFVRDHMLSEEGMISPVVPLQLRISTIM